MIAHALAAVQPRLLPQWQGLPVTEADCEAMIRVFGEWVKQIDIDGFRIDTLKHVEYDFWREFCPGIRKIAAERGKKNFFMFGEAYDGDDGLVGSYTQANMVDSAFYFPQKYVAIDGVIKFNAPTKNIEDLWARKALYGQQPQPGGIGIAPAKIPVNFIDVSSSTNAVRLTNSAQITFSSTVANPKPMRQPRKRGSPC